LAVIAIDGAPRVWEIALMQPSAGLEPSKRQRNVVQRIITNTGAASRGAHPGRIRRNQPTSAYEKMRNFKRVEQHDFKTAK
jgi:hypothetical protein